jgi:subtilase family serine protease
MPIKRLVAVALLLGLAACSAPHALGPSFVAPAQNSVMNPDHGASALPGGWLPCGFPTGGDNNGGGDSGGDVTGTIEHEASCSVAISTYYGYGSGMRSADDGSNVQGLHPADINNAYHFPSSKPGTTVAIVDAFNDPQAESDMNVYRAQFHLPACTSANGCFTKLNQAGKAGPYPAASTAWSHEVAVDTEMVSAVCPHCKILLIEASSASMDDLGKSVDEAVALGAHVVSNSYYAVEWKGETAEDVHYNHPGVAITVSSGDVAASCSSGSSSSSSCGGDAATTGKSAPYYPASSPYVTAVGGTSLWGSGAGRWKQQPWQFAGLGCSRYETRPKFQKPVCKTRSSVDMAVDGDPQTGVSIYSTLAGGWVIAGGTSVGSPIVAAAYALSARPAGPAYSYDHRGDFRNVGPPGFGKATGLGSPNGVLGL